MRFLIIDDSDVDSHALGSILESLEHQVDRLNSPLQAVNKIEAESYDSVFLDVVMPEQDGYKLLRMIRMNPQTSEQYVVFCSSKTTPIEVEYGLKRANDYLTKPVSRESVKEIIDRVPAGKG
jgi:CheY-like chemotaxis protein